MSVISDNCQPICVGDRYAFLFTVHRKIPDVVVVAKVWEDRDKLHIQLSNGTRTTLNDIYQYCYRVHDWPAKPPIHLHKSKWGGYTFKYKGVLYKLSRNGFYGGRRWELRVWNPKAVQPPIYVGATRAACLDWFKENH